MPYQLLQTFEGLFTGQPYLHRKSNLGDSVAVRLYEDLHALNRSQKYVSRVSSARSVLNTANKRTGKTARRGDGSFGESVPHEPTISEPGFVVQRGSIATIEIGIEVKILMKAMIKQIDRVISDLKGQAAHFRAHGGNPICVGVVGINHAAHCTTYEGTRAFPTDGKTYKHPIQEALAAEQRLMAQAAPAFDEFIILRFEATNVPPYNFRWVNASATQRDYGAALVRISSEYQSRVP